MSGLSSKPDAKSGSGMSSVGNSGVYEADDQRTLSRTERGSTERYGEGKVNSHKPNDSKDQRSIANRLSKEEMSEKRRRCYENKHKATKEARGEASRKRSDITGTSNSDLLGHVFSMLFTSHFVEPTAFLFCPIQFPQRPRVSRTWRAKRQVRQNPSSARAEFPPSGRNEARTSLMQSLLQTTLHGNEPSKGAKVDKQIADEAEIITKKEPKKKNS